MPQTDLDQVKRTIADVAEALKHGKENDNPCSVLIGAGCSVTADIPLAANFVDKVKKKYSGAFDRAQKKSSSNQPLYPDVMGELDTGPRYDLISDCVKDSKQLNWAHILLGYLVKKKYVGRILTTNFDDLTLRALALYHIFPSVYDMAVSTKFDADLVRDPSVFFLHGQHGGFSQLHTKEEVKKQKNKLAPAFKDASIRRTWLVVGYSGDNDPVFENLAERKFNHGLYWVGYQHNYPSDNVRKRLLSRKNQAYWVEGFDADKFFYKLCQELELDLPPFIVDPFSHQLDVLEHLKPYSDGKEAAGFDFLQKPKSLLKQAKECFIENSPQCPKKLYEQIEKEDMELKKDIDTHQQEEEDKRLYKGLVEQARNLYFKGRYEDTVKLIRGSESIETELEDLLALALLNWGNDLYEKAKNNEGSQADSLFNQASEKYEQTLKIKPDYHIALNNLGTVLVEKSKYQNDQEVDRSLDQAYENFSEALKIKPDYHDTLFNLGCLFAQKQDVETAIEWLEKRRQIESPPLTQEEITNDSDFDPIRDDPKFQEFVASLPSEANKSE